MANGVTFLVRTFCATYNHESYITDAIQGFVMQETSFPVVYTIVDDASTDKTAEVLRRFVNEHFDVDSNSGGYDKDTDYGHVTFAQHKTNKNCYFAVIYLKENHYSQKKSKAPYLTEWMDTKYVAMCEGDDYWTYPLKLQKQVDFLEKHLDYSMCTHAALWESDGELYNRGCQHEEECALSTDEVIKCGGLYLATASLVYRKELVNDSPEWRELSDVGDFPLQILGTLRGGLWFLPAPMCVYRFMHAGSWTVMISDRFIEHAFTEIKWLRLLDKDTDKKYHKAIQTHLFSKFIRFLFRENKISTSQYVITYLEAEKQISVYHFLKDILRHFLISIKIGFNKAVKKNQQSE